MRRLSRSQVTMLEIAATDAPILTAYGSARERTMLSLVRLGLVSRSWRATNAGKEVLKRYKEQANDQT